MSPVIYGCMRIDDVESSLTCKINQGCLSDSGRERRGGGGGGVCGYLGRGTGTKRFLVRRYTHGILGAWHLRVILMFATDRSCCLGPGTMFRKLIVFRGVGG